MTSDAPVVADCSAAPEGRPDIIHMDLRLDEPIASRRALGLAQDADDADVARAAHETWGRDLPDRLRGDLTIGIRDDRGLWLHRDPSGLRPFYFSVLDRCQVLLATTVDVLSDGSGTDDVDERAVAHFLLALPSDPGRTFRRSVTEVPPGATVHIRDGDVRVLPFAPDAPDPATSARQTTDADLDARFDDALLRAVNRRLGDRSGLLLSGGTDSMAIGCALGRLVTAGERRADHHPTFGFAFDELADDDERAVSAGLVEHYGLDAVAVDGDQGWLFGEWPGAGLRDDPWMLPEHGLSELAAAAAADRGVRRLLTGDRGDEAIGHGVWDDWGVLRRHGPGRLFGELRREGRATRSGLARTAVRRLGRHPDDGPNLSPGPAPPGWVPAGLLARTDAMDRDSPPRPEWLDAPSRRARWSWLHHGPAVEMARYRAQVFGAHGVTALEPWADRDLIDLLVTAPQSRVQTRGQPKAIGRRLLDRHLPAGVARRAGKHLPEAMFAKTFRQDGTDRIRDLFAASAAEAAGWIDAAAVQTAFESFLSGLPPQHDFWRPLALELWLRRISP